MTRRREFLMAMAGVGAPRTGDKIAGATELGPISFCRVAHTGWVGRASNVIDLRQCILEVDPAAEGATLLGSRGTLVITEKGWQRYGE